METKDWITIISVIIVTVGWFVNGGLSRKNEIAKKRFDYRMSALQSFLKVWKIIDENDNPFTVPEFLPLLKESRINFQLYGKDDEIKLFEQFINYVEQQNLEKSNDSFNKLTSLIRSKIRQELNI